MFDFHRCILQSLYINSMMKLNFNAHTTPIVYTGTHTHTGTGTQLLFAFVVPPQHSRFFTHRLFLLFFFAFPLKIPLRLLVLLFLLHKMNERTNVQVSGRKGTEKKLHLCVANHFQENIIFFHMHIYIHTNLYAKFSVH